MFQYTYKSVAVYYLSHIDSQAATRDCLRDNLGKFLVSNNISRSNEKSPFQENEFFAYLEVSSNSCSPYYCSNNKLFLFIGKKQLGLGFERVKHRILTQT